MKPTRKLRPLGNISCSRSYPCLIRMVWSTGIIDAHWLDATWTGGGKHLPKYFTLASIILNSFLFNSQKKGSWWYSVIFMDIVGGKISSCMDVITSRTLKKPGFTLISCLRFAPSFLSTTQGLETKSRKKPQPELPCLTISRSLPYIPWRAPSVGWMKALMPTTTSQLITWCRPEEIFAGPSWSSRRFRCRSNSRLDCWRTFRVN